MSIYRLEVIQNEIKPNSTRVSRTIDSCIIKRNTCLLSTNSFGCRYALVVTKSLHAFVHASVHAFVHVPLTFTSNKETCLRDPLKILKLSLEEMFLLQGCYNPPPLTTLPSPYNLQPHTHHSTKLLQPSTIHYCINLHTKS